MADEKKEQVDGLRKAAEELIGKRDALHARQKQLIGARDEAIGRGNATDVLARGQELKQTNDELMQLCSQLDKGLADYEIAKDDLFSRDHLAVRAKANEIGREIKALKEQLATLQAAYDAETARIQPRVDVLAREKEVRQKFISDSRAVSTNIVQLSVGV